MNADIKGALELIGMSYRTFTHKGKPMTREQVTSVLKWGLEQGYTSTGQISDKKVDMILKRLKDEIPDELITRTSLEERGFILLKNGDMSFNLTERGNGKDVLFTIDNNGYCKVHREDGNTCVGFGYLKTMKELSTAIKKAYE